LESDSSRQRAPLRVVVAGATGFVGRVLVPAICSSSDLQLVGAVARRTAGQDVGTVLGLGAVGVPIVATVAAALEAPADVLVEYTGAATVKRHTAAALAAGVSVVVGASGLTGADDQELDALARAAHRGVVVAGNFSMVAALAKRLVVEAAAQLPMGEVLDYAEVAKPDAPSGTAREWAQAIAHPAGAAGPVPPEAVVGDPAARGAQVAGVPVHSIRVPGHALSVEWLAGVGEERLAIRYDGGSSAAPYVAGTLLAIRRVMDMTGLVRGLEHLLP
jgi:4-hydroxy-tetrahydrodipicolinate reductase